MTGKNSIKYHYERKKIFTITKRWKILLMQVTCTQKKVVKILRYFNLHVQGDTLLLADVFYNFRNMCLEIYRLASAHFIYAPGLAWQTALKKTKLKLLLLTDIDILLILEDAIKGRICYPIYR